MRKPARCGYVDTIANNRTWDRIFNQLRSMFCFHAASVSIHDVRDHNCFLVISRQYCQNTIPLIILVSVSNQHVVCISACACCCLQKPHGLNSELSCAPFHVVTGLDDLQADIAVRVVSEMLVGMLDASLEILFPLHVGQS